MALSFPNAFRLHQNQALFVNFGEGGVAWKTQIFGPTNNVTLVWWSMEFVYCAVQCVCCQILFSLSRVLGVMGKVWCRVTQDGETSSWWMLWDRLRDSLIVFEILSVLGVEWPNDEHHPWHQAPARSGLPSSFPRFRIATRIILSSSGSGSSFNLIWCITITSWKISKSINYTSRLVEKCSWHWQVGN